MRYPIALITALFVIGVLANPVVASETTPAVATMAEILADLNHFPSDAEKETLSGIIADEDTGDHERAVAMALLNVEHQVRDDDRAELESVLADETAPKPVKTLAKVIVNLNHAPSEDEQAKLAKLSEK